MTTRSNKTSSTPSEKTQRTDTPEAQATTEGEATVATVDTDGQVGAGDIKVPTAEGPGGAEVPALAANVAADGGAVAVVGLVGPQVDEHQNALTPIHSRVAKRRVLKDPALELQLSDVEELQRKGDVETVDEGGVELEMLTQVGGTRDGKPWPHIGQTLSLPEDEAARAIAAGWARRAQD